MDPREWIITLLVYKPVASELWKMNLAFEYIIVTVLTLILWIISMSPKYSNPPLLRDTHDSPQF